MYFSFLYYFIVYQNCKIRIINMGDYMTSVISKNLFLVYNALEIVIKSSDKIFIDINSYNKFWRNYFQIIYYFLTPLNLILLNMLFSHRLIFLTRILSFSFLAFGLANLVFNLSTASINNEINKFYKNLKG